MSIHVLFLAAEAEPFVKIGGLADVAGALPVAIHHISQSSKDADKVEIRLVLPFHSAIKHNGFTKIFRRILSPKGERKNTLPGLSVIHSRCARLFLGWTTIDGNDICLFPSS